MKTSKSGIATVIIFITLFALIHFGFNTPGLFAKSETPIKLDEVQSAKKVRDLIGEISQHHTQGQIIPVLKSKVADLLEDRSSESLSQVFDKLNHDSTFINHCLYVAELYQNYMLRESKHFKFYFQNEDSITEAKIKYWDDQYERLSALFQNQLTEKIPFKIEPNEKFGRCFAPWEVRWGIRQQGAGKNVHELAHIMIFRYSDVPFFHEPLAFIYGTFQGDFEKAEQYHKEHKHFLRENGYISAKELLHFPQIIGLDETKWASAFYFNYQLIKKFGLVKLLKLMRCTTWEISSQKFENNFKKIYKISLCRVEAGLAKEFKN